MSDYPMERAAQIAGEVLDLHEKGQTLEGEAWNKNAEAYKAKCIASAAILAVKLQDALAVSGTLAAGDVLAERRRQIEKEGYTHAHDDAHANAELAFAAACYAADSPFQHDGRRLWPWDWKCWKPQGPRSNLVRAAALILAEIERLDRAAAKAEAE